MNTNFDFREQALPPSASQVDTDEYKNIEIDKMAPEYAEPLVDLADFGIRTDAFYAQDDGLNAPLCRRFQSAMRRVYLRESVARKLCEANGLLAMYGMTVVVLDGFRPIPVQSELWQWMLEQARALLPNGTSREWESFALRYASDPTTFNANDATTWPTHATGGSVDLTLAHVHSGERAYMGSIYLDSSSVSSTRHFESLENADSASQKEACRNRRLLFWAMTAVGFVNYPFEWWHYDYLTQASVMNQGMPDGLKASYGLANCGKYPEQ